MHRLRRRLLASVLVLASLAVVLVAVPPAVEASGRTVFGELFSVDG